jgi:hypothetical protein
VSEIREDHRGVTILSGANDASWVEFLHRSRSHFFDTTLWSSSLIDLFSNIKSYRLAAINHDQIVGGLALFQTSSFISGRKLINAPFHLSSSLLVNDAGIFEKMIARIVTLARETDVDHVELTIPPCPFADFALTAGFDSSVNYFTPTIYLGNTYEETFLNYKKQFRTNLRKIRLDIGGIGDVRCVLLDSIKELKEFYEILAMEYKNKHYNLPPPFKLIRKLWETCEGIQEVLVYGLRAGRRLVAGNLILVHKDVAHYAWSAADSGFQDLAVSTYLLDVVIRSFYDRDRKVRYFNLGPVSPHNRGLCFFKSRWGAEFVRPNVYTLNLKGKSITKLDSERGAGPARRMIRFLPRAGFGVVTDLFYKYLV